MRTIANVLHHHGITGEGDTLTDNAREAGIIMACLGCGSVAGINPDTDPDPVTREAARQATRDSIDFDSWDCCPDADTVVY